MGSLYDSGWVPAASGALSATILTRGAHALHIQIAASGGVAPTTASAGWIGGGDTVVPWWPKAIPYGCTPRPTGTLVIAAPAANGVNSYYLGAGLTGTAGWLGGFVYPTIFVNTKAGTTSSVRLIVDAI